LSAVIINARAVVTGELREGQGDNGGPLGALLVGGGAQPACIVGELQLTTSESTLCDKLAAFVRTAGTLWRAKILDLGGDPYRTSRRQTPPNAGAPYDGNYDQGQQRCKQQQRWGMNSDQQLQYVNIPV